MICDTFMGTRHPLREAYWYHRAHCSFVSPISTVPPCNFCVLERDRRIGTFSLWILNETVLWGDLAFCVANEIQYYRIHYSVESTIQRATHTQKILIYSYLRFTNIFDEKKRGIQGNVCSALYISKVIYDQRIYRAILDTNHIFLCR